MKADYLYVTPFFPSPGSWRGAVGYDFAKGLIAAGRFNVHVFVPGRDFGGYEIGGIKVRTFPIKALPSAVLPFLFARRNKRNFLEAVRRAGIDPSNVAVCHGNLAYMGVYPLAMKAANPRCLTLLHHHDPMSFGLTFGRLRHFWPYKLWHFPELRRMHEAIDCHVFISEAVKRSFLAAPRTPFSIYGDYKRQMSSLGFYRPVRIKDSIVLPNGVDTDVFFPKPKAAGMPPPPDAAAPKCAAPAPVIGCVGNFVQWKDQATLIRAIAMLKTPVSVRFVGTGPLLEDCKRLAAAVVKPPSKVEFIPQMPHEALPDFYRSLDLFVLPSYCEGFGCVFTESWACGTPFITCEGQGMDDLVPPEDRHLWLVPPRNPSALAAAIEHYLSAARNACAGNAVGSLPCPAQRLQGPVTLRDTTRFFLDQLAALQKRTQSPYGNRDLRNW